MSSASASLVSAASKKKSRWKRIWLRHDRRLASRRCFGLLAFLSGRIITGIFSRCDGFPAWLSVSDGQHFIAGSQPAI
jgi:hypothetical protein